MFDSYRERSILAVMREKSLPFFYCFVVILHHKEGVDLIPANIELSAIEVSLVNAMSRELILKSMVEKLRDFYDFIIIDCMGEHCKTVLCLLYKRTILVFSSFFIFLLFSYGA